MFSTDIYGFIPSACCYRLPSATLIPAMFTVEPDRFVIISQEWPRFVKLDDEPDPVVE